MDLHNLFIMKDQNKIRLRNKSLKYFLRLQSGYNQALTPVFLSRGEGNHTLLKHCSNSHILMPVSCTFHSNPLLLRQCM